MGDGTVIVIGGGVGPMAGVALHAKIIQQTITDGTDQSHLPVYHFSRPDRIPDRTEYLLSLAAPGGGVPGGGKPRLESRRRAAGGDDPALAMAEVFESAALSLGGAEAVGGVPCNTFHAPAIFSRFSMLAAERARPIRLVNMLDETVGLLRARLPGLRIGQAPYSGPRRSELVGVLSTTGTRLSGVYDVLLGAAGYQALYVPEADQALLHASIYDATWGIKATPEPSGRAVETLGSMMTGLVGRGARAIILACTELPLAFRGTDFSGVPLVDPVLALARALVREAAPDKLAPL